MNKALKMVFVKTLLLFRMIRLQQELYELIKDIDHDSNEHEKQSAKNERVDREKESGSNNKRKRKGNKSNNEDKQDNNLKKEFSDNGFESDDALSLIATARNKLAQLTKRHKDR